MKLSLPVGEARGEGTRRERDSGPVDLTVSVVVPVYQGESTLRPLLEEITPWTHSSRTPAGHSFRVTEVVLVHDGGPDCSDRVMQDLADRHSFVKLVWLSRNYGQHPALVAGMSETTGEWVATLDEDGQHDPADLGKMIDRALESQAQLVYARPLNPPPHGPIRNLASRLAKWISGSMLSAHKLSWFHSYRLIDGEVARGISAHCATHVYLDVALSWVIGRVSVCPLFMRKEWGRRSGYNYRMLFTHFWRLVLASGTKPLRMVACAGLLWFLAGTGLSLYACWSRFVWKLPVEGWTSLMIVLCFFGGVLFLALAVIAEYLGISLTMAMGKPLYLAISRPCRREIPKPQAPV